MTEQRIMYVCTRCADDYPECCGYFDRADLRAMPNGDWFCEGCFDDTDQMDRGNLDEDKYLAWSDMPVPPAYGEIPPALVAQRIEQLPSKQSVAGSIPAERATRSVSSPDRSGDA